MRAPCINEYLSLRTHIMANINSVKSSLSLPVSTDPSPVAMLLPSFAAKACSISRNRIASGNPRMMAGRIDKRRSENSTGCQRFSTPRMAATRGWRKEGAATDSPLPSLLSRIFFFLLGVLTVVVVDVAGWEGLPFGGVGGRWLLVKVWTDDDFLFLFSRIAVGGVAVEVAAVGVVLLMMVLLAVTAA